jgi:site-specific DNA-methyltransferase (adenine-specific)
MPDSYIFPPQHMPSLDSVVTSLRSSKTSPNKCVHRDVDKGLYLVHGNTLEFMDALAEEFPTGICDMIFADPPYFLSNGGISCQGGKMVKVDKGNWDKSEGADVNHAFNREWLSRCQRLLKKDGTIWVSGTAHVIHSIGFAMQQLGMKLLNDITWEKPNPPPNLACRYFTHATETVIWAAKSEKSKHCFNYSDMKQENGGKQMKSVWRMTAPGAGEKEHGKHPTQKPLALMSRCIRASTNEGDLVFDPFMGSGSTAVAAVSLGRKFCGVEQLQEYVELATRRVVSMPSELNLTSRVTRS